MNQQLLSTLESVLASANGRSRERLITVERAISLIEYAEEQVRLLPPEQRTLVTYQFQEGVAKSYTYAAMATMLIVHFDSDGTAVKVQAKRSYAPKTRFGRNVSRLKNESLEKIDGFHGAYKKI